MRALLSAGLRDDDLRYLLDMSLWRYTEFDKNRWKMGIRYRSAEVMGTAVVEIRHEHVVERRWLLDQITGAPDRLEDFLQFAVACIVSKEEDVRLRVAVGFGWERYLAAGIDVVDTTDMHPVDVLVLAGEQRALASRLGLEIASTSRRSARSAAVVVPAGSATPLDAVTSASFDQRLEALAGGRGGRSVVHRAVHDFLLSSGFTPYSPASPTADYLTYRDRQGRNFLNMTSTVVHVMRQDLRPRLVGLPGVRLGGRYPQVPLDGVDVIATLRGVVDRMES
jgi:hypothetical protein